MIFHICWSTYYLMKKTKTIFHKSRFFILFNDNFKIQLKVINIMFTLMVMLMNVHFLSNDINVLGIKCFLVKFCILFWYRNMLSKSIFRFYTITGSTPLLNFCKYLNVKMHNSRSIYIFYNSNILFILCFVLKLIN